MAPANNTTIILASLAMLLTVGNPAPTQASTNAPSLVCDAPMFDFGNRYNTEEIPHTFVIQNKGVAPLVISQVRTGCGCTQAQLDRTTIPPGESASLSARLALRKHIGPKQTAIYLHTNDPDHPVFLCQFKGVAIPEVEITPAMLNIGITPQPSNQTVSVVLQNRTAIPFRIISLDRPHSFASVQVTTNEPGQKYTLEVSCVTSGTTTAVQGVMTVWTDHPSLQRLDIPFSLSVIRELNAFPSELSLTENVRNKLLESRYIILQARENRRFSIREIQVIPSTLPVSIQTINPGRVYLKVGPMRPSRELNGTVIRVLTDLPEQPVLEIPVRVSAP